MGIIIFVTGTPGVGKSRLARSLSNKHGYKLVELSQLVKKERLYTRFDRDRKSYVIDERRLRQRLKTISRSADKLVITSHMVGGFLPKSLIGVALVLRLDPLILYRRLRNRGWSRHKAWENTEAEIVDLTLQETLKLLGEKRVFEIDTTRRSAALVYKEAMRALSAKRPNRAGRVNWLSRYDPIELERKL